MRSGLLACVSRKFVQYLILEVVFFRGSFHAELIVAGERSGAHFTQERVQSNLCSDMKRQGTDFNAASVSTKIPHEMSCDKLVVLYSRGTRRH